MIEILGIINRESRKWLKDATSQRPAKKVGLKPVTPGSNHAGGTQINLGRHTSRLDDAESFCQGARKPALEVQNAHPFRHYSDTDHLGSFLA